MQERTFFISEYDAVTARLDLTYIAVSFSPKTSKIYQYKGTNPDLNCLIYRTDRNVRREPSVLTNTVFQSVSDATSRKPVVDEGAVGRAATYR